MSNEQLSQAAIDGMNDNDGEPEGRYRPARSNSVDESDWQIDEIDLYATVDMPCEFPLCAVCGMILMPCEPECLVCRREAAIEAFRRRAL